MDAFSPSATTRTFALLGDPVAHSLSPTFQNAALRHCGLDAVYVALRCDAQAVGPLIRALVRAGGGGNVTVPHKSAAAQCLEVVTEAVLRTGACNTFWSDDGVLCGDNTDVAGFRHATRLLMPSLAGTRVLVLGAGGAAAAALHALLEDDVAHVTLINRSPDRARALAARYTDAEDRIAVVTSVVELEGKSFDLVTNATAAGLRDDDPLPLDLHVLRRCGVALDLVYRASGTTEWTRHARSIGVSAADGRELLLGQGAAAFERWFGRPAPLDVMRAALPGV
jgi:shikimate dehydrogenase